MTAQPETPAGEVPEWTIGWRLQRALAHAGIQAGDIAIELGVSRATVSRWLNDRGDTPLRWAYIDRWAQLTGVPALWLCHGDLKPCGPRLTLVRDVSAGQARSNFMQRFSYSDMAS